MGDLEQKIKEAAEAAVLKFIRGEKWFDLDYQNRFKIPAEWLKEAWQMVDRQAMQKKLAERIETELVDRMVNHIAAELATDIKQILSVQERREMIRAIARDHMDAIMKAGTK